MEKTQVKRIYMYPGLGEGERHYLNLVGTVRDLAETGLVLREGLTVTFYDIDGTDEGDRDDLLFDGKVYFDSSLKQWYTLIDWESFRHDSDERNFHEQTERSV